MGQVNITPLIVAEAWLWFFTEAEFGEGFRAVTRKIRYIG